MKWVQDEYKKNLRLISIIIDWNNNLIKLMPKINGWDKKLKISKEGKNN